MKFAKKENTLCFSEKELSLLFEVSKKGELFKEMIEHGITFGDLRRNYSKLEALASTISKKGAQHRDEHEIFAALFIFSNYYPNSEICFEVRGFNPVHDKIETLADLIRLRDGVTSSDFIIRSQDGLRKFELKRYRGDLNTQGAFNFIKEKIAHYANDLGDTNLLIVCQPVPHSTSYISFHELYDKLKSLNLKFQGQVLLAYNQNNEKQIIVQVHPALTKTEIPLQLPSSK